jgi:hypothetical protein
MQNLKLFAALGAVGLSAAVAVACGSSSSPATGGHDAGSDAVVSPGDDGNVPTSCSVLGGANGLCGDPTLTCCVDIASGFSQTCLPPSQCSSNIQVGCVDHTSCSTGQVCCADFGNVDAGALAAFEDGGLGALGIDAAALQSEAGASGIAGMFGNATFKVSCQSSCTSTQIQACASSPECQNGATCVPISELFPADASVPGDAGSVGGFNIGSLLSSAGMYMACLSSLDASTMLPEASTTDAAPEASVPEASTDQ